MFFTIYTATAPNTANSVLDQLRPPLPECITMAESRDRQSEQEAVHSNTQANHRRKHKVSPQQHSISKDRQFVCP